MYLLEVDITNHLQLIFNFINKVYEFLLSIELTAFGYKFSLLGLFLALMLLIIIIKFLKLGFESETSTSIKYNRIENSKNINSDYQPRHREGRFNKNNDNRYKSKWI